MKTSKSQLGASLWETCMYVTMFLFVVTVALKLGPLYIDDMNIGLAINSVHEGLESKDINDLTTSEIKSRLSKNFQVSMIDLELLKNLEVEKTGGKVLLKLSYDARNTFVGNIDILVHFDHEVDLAEPVKK